MFDALKDETYGVLREWVEENLEVFDDSMYIRTLVHYTLAEHLVKPIWEDVSVPFNEEGIWEAVLLYAAPNIMPGVWHAYYTHIDPVCNESMGSMCRLCVLYNLSNANTFINMI